MNFAFIKRCTVLFIFLVAYLLQLTSIAYAQTNRPVIGYPGAATIAPRPGTYAAGTALNYVRTWQPLIPMTSESVVLSGQHGEVQQTIQYLDGLGRPLQTVARGIAPIAQGQTVPGDFVTPFVYDPLGREVYKYLPFTSNENSGRFKDNAFSQQADFMDANFQSEQVHYSRTEYEASPSNRVISTFAPGNSWGGNNRGVLISYETNTNNEVAIWNIGVEEASVPSFGGYYNAGMLYRTITKDENGMRVIEYKDKEGLVILKKVEEAASANIAVHENWLNTYYVYDNLNQLRFVMPPVAVQGFESNGWSLSGQQTRINELCFQYAFDDKGRMTAKKVPGADWVYMLYDSRDRLVFTQDGNMRLRQQWLASLYDNLNRPVQTGMITYGSSRQQLQAFLDNLSVSSVNTYSGTATGTPANLIVSEHDGRSVYRATNTIIFENGFLGEDYEAEIIAEDGKAFTSEQDINLNPVNPLPPGATAYVPLTFTYYDAYSWTERRYIAANNSKLGKGNNAYGEPLPSEMVLHTKGFITGTRTRVIEDAGDLSKGSWLESVNFYDSKGRIVQVQSDNYKGGDDVVTNKYDFAGKLISSYLVHNNPSGNTNVRIYTEWDYDHGGRLVEIRKTLNDNAASTRVLVKNSYDGVGQLKNRLLGQKTDASGVAIPGDFLESQDYSYNIRGWLKGINWQDAAGGSQGGPTPTNWFRMNLSYDWGYQKNQFNGNISGIRWQSAGDGAERSFGYDYDAANRLLLADFSQYVSGQWTNQTSSGKTVDFTVKMGDGANPASAYDANGNIKQMRQWGMIPGGGSGQIDNLVYEYHHGNNSNKLKSVSDNMPGYHLGDFEDKNTGDDYGYDANGNMVVDLNKRLNGLPEVNVGANGGAIQYNYLNLPWRISVKDDNGNDKGTITYIYDAAGNKLEKRVQELPSSSNNQQTRNMHTSYLGQFFYENNVLKFFGHEEGRVRRNRSTANNSSFDYVYDYFIKDHLGNVRVVLSDEVGSGKNYPASMEDAMRSVEVQLFDKIPEMAADKPSGFDSDPKNQKVSKLFGEANNDKRIGPGLVLKVMKGDKFRAAVNAWYLPGTDVGEDPGLGNLSSSLISAFIGGLPASGGAHGLGATLQSNGSLTGPMTSFLSSGRGNTDGVPKAYLNWMVLDEEQFELVNNNYGASQVPVIAGVEQKKLIAANGGTDIEVLTNGYLYVYVSNESRGNVYFDDLSVVHTPGPLLEETHYYPFGLTMAGISSKAAGMLHNRLKYNGKELQEDDFADGKGIGLYDYGARLYDPQIGRLLEIDAKSEKYNGVSPYVYVVNNPVIANDPDGNDLVIVTVPSGRNKQGKVQTQKIMVDQNIAKQTYAFAWAMFNKYGATVNEHYRTRSKQEELFKLKQEGRNPNPVAPPGTSNHEGGFALDFNGLGVSKKGGISEDEKKKIEEYREFAKQYGFDYLGGFDPPHFMISPLTYYDKKHDDIKANAKYYNEHKKDIPEYQIEVGGGGNLMDGVTLITNALNKAFGWTWVEMMRLYMKYELYEAKRRLSEVERSRR